MTIVSPSILAADFSKLLEEVKSVDNAEYIHIDVMDGHFVPNLTIGPCVVKSLRNHSNMFFDVHLMIEDPMKYAQAFKESGADLITFHFEAVKNVDEMIKHLKELNVKVGISIKPNTNIEVLNPYLDKLDLVLVMSVEPGYGGQKFLDSAIDKIKYLKEYKKRYNSKFLIEVDGGINKETAKIAVDAGCEVLVAGTYIFKSENRKETIKELNLL